MAFDLVDHELMIHKLRLYGCSGTSLQWFSSYLSGQYQHISYDGHFSDPLPVTLGIPQGPLFFILVINDLVLEAANAHLEMYADDSTLCTAAKSVEKTINSTLTAQAKPVYCWISINCMVLNVDKTEFMLLGTVKRLNSALKDFSVSENEYIIKPVNTHKLLGLHIDTTLSRTTNVSHICSKLCSRLYLFNKIKNHMPAFVRKQYYDGLVQPVIYYRCVIWGSGSHDLLLKVHKTVNMYARSMMNIRDKELIIPTIELFEILDIMPIDIHIKYFTGIQMYNILHVNAPSYLCKLFSGNDTIHNHNTRNSHSLHISKYKLVTGQRTFKFRVAHNFSLA